MSLTPPPFAARSAWDPPPPARRTAPAAAIRASSPYDTIPGTVLLAGITGDSAYGFPTDHLERIAVYATPARDLTGLNPPADTVVTRPPDVVGHEAATYLRLVLAGSPALLELLWLDGITTPSGVPLWEVVEPVAMRLIELRHQLVSAGTVRDAYLEYASTQLVHLSRNPHDTADTARRARHVARLMRQGYTLYTTGVLPVRVDDPGWYDDFAAHPDRWLAWFEDEARGWERARSALVSRPNTAAAQEWLAEVRATFP